MGKGSKRRREDCEKVRRNWDMVFGKHNPNDTRKIEIDMPSDLHKCGDIGFSGEFKSDRNSSPS